MLASFKRIARNALPRQLVDRLYRWAPSHRRDARRCGWANRDTNELFPNFRIDPCDTYVDVGCGKGSACLFAARCGAEVIAVDIVAELIDALREDLKQTKARASAAYVSDGNPLPLESEMATRIACQEVMEHVADPAQFMNELVRIGKPGARYLLSVPDPAAEQVQKRIAPPCYWQPPNHIRIFQRDEFARLVVNAGLRIEKRANCSFYESMWWIMFWGAGKNLPFGSGATPQLKLLNKLWGSMIGDPKYAKVVAALDEMMPKSQILIAVKD